MTQRQKDTPAFHATEACIDQRIGIKRKACGRLRRSAVTCDFICATTANLSDEPVSEDRKAYLLTCLASHHEVGDVALYPVITESGRGLVEAPPELKAPFSDYESISLREFLGIPRSTGRHAVHTIGNFHVLAVNLDDKDDEVVAMVLNPDSDLKRFYQVLPLGLVLSEEDRATIVSEYKVEDPFVLERLSAAWNPYAAPPPRTEAR